VASTLLLHHPASHCEAQARETACYQIRRIGAEWVRGDLQGRQGGSHESCDPTLAVPEGYLILSVTAGELRQQHPGLVVAGRRIEVDPRAAEFRVFQGEHIGEAPDW
jgi:hypothetical protein